MAERGARPKVPQWRVRTLHALRALFTPLLPDDYLELINPLWSTQELRGRIERIQPETPNAATIVIKPGWEWEGHEPGQYLRIGMAVDGIHHWRAYSLTSDPARPDGCISITPKLVETGKVSPFLVRHARAGAIVRLGGVEGTFVLPDPLPERILFISAGSGITPIMSMVRSLAGRGALSDVVLLHSARTHDDVIFGAELRAARGPPSRPPRARAAHERDGPDGAARPRLALPRLARARDVHQRPGRHARRDGRPLGAPRRHPPSPHGALPAADRLRGRRARRRRHASASETAAWRPSSDGATPILVAGENAGATLPYGCRMGICHTCVGQLCSGRIRDLRTGKVSGSPGEVIRTCVNAPEGPVEIAL